MAEMKALRATILLLLLISLFHIPKAASKPFGFSLKLIRSYSPMSLDRKNTTFLERFKSYVLATKARATYWTSFEATANKTNQPNVIQPSLKNEGRRVVVEMSIGTPGQKVFLAFDTGSKITWTQCAFCTTCFSQSTPKFDPRHSSSFRIMFPDDPNCQPPTYSRERPCKYRVSYLNRQYSTGVASYDTFSSMDNNPSQTAPHLRFGCSVEAAGFRFPPNTIISGILGMSRSEESLPHQLNQYYGGRNQFSYCLVDLNTAPSVVTWVTFGDDIPDMSGQNLAHVPFIEHRLRHAWAINLFDISVGDEHLNLPPDLFSPTNPSGSGGLVLDSGSLLTVLTRDAYLAIKSKIRTHLSRSGDFTEIQGNLGLCYRYNGPPGQLPMNYLQTITFHLDHANLVVPVTSVYVFDRARNTFCLGMLEAESNWPNLLGALSQQDTRLLYNIDQNSLFFIPELCARNRA